MVVVVVKLTGVNQYITVIHVLSIDDSIVLLWLCGQGFVPKYVLMTWQCTIVSS